MERIDPHEFLSSATTILDVVELFGAKRNEHFYVIHVNEVIGVLRLMTTESAKPSSYTSTAMDMMPNPNQSPEIAGG